MKTEELVPVSQHAGWSRHPETGALINTNKEEYVRFMTSRKRAYHVQQRLDSLELAFSEMNDKLKTMIEIFKNYHQKDETLNKNDNQNI
jgi:uncharacterized protein YfbU (UPF0304 family)